MISSKGVKKLHKLAKKGETSQLEDFVEDYYNEFGYFNDEEIAVMTHFLQYTLLVHGNAKRRTGRLYSGHPIDVAKNVVDLYKPNFESMSKFFESQKVNPYPLHEVRSSLVNGGMLADRLTVLDPIVGFTHDIPEETKEGDNPITPLDLRLEFESFVLTSPSIKNKNRFLNMARSYEGLVTKLTNYDVNTGSSRDYYEFTQAMVDDEGYQMNLLSGIYYVNLYAKLLKLKGSDISENITETEDLFKDIPSQLYISARALAISIVGENTWLKRYLSKLSHDAREATARQKKTLLTALAENLKIASHNAEKDKSINGVQKLFTFYKGFRVIDSINKFMNLHGYEVFLSNLKEQIIMHTLERIDIHSKHILKYHCKGFNQDYLDTDNRDLYLQDGSIRKVFDQIENGWTGYVVRDLSSEEFKLSLSFKELRLIYESKGLSSNNFDVLDKLHLDFKYANYHKQKAPQRRTVKQFDEKYYPFEILKEFYDQAIEGDKGPLQRIRGNNRQQYVHLMIFKDLMFDYLTDIFEGKEHKIILPSQVGLLRYQVFDWKGRG